VDAAVERGEERGAGLRDALRVDSRVEAARDQVGIVRRGHLRHLVNREAEHFAGLSGLAVRARRQQCRERQHRNYKESHVFFLKFNILSA
jgi:hypothetical protein